MLTVGSLFSGIGGMDLGLERAGMIVCWMVEIDPFCQKVLAKHWPDVERFGDVRECGKHNLKPVDLICGGFPCQPHSVAGKQRGKEDNRNLWPEYRRVVEEMRPRWVLAENVLGIRTTMLDEVLSDLEGLAYTVGTLIVPACAFNAPHRRERVFVVAYAAGNGRQRGQRADEHECQHDAMGRREQPWRNGDNGDVADAKGRGAITVQQRRQRDGAVAGSQAVADASRQSRNGSDDNGRSRPQQMSKFRDSAEETRSLSSWWAVESDVGRVVDGISSRLDSARIWDREPNIPRVAREIPNRVDRLRALGNAVVPQVAEWIGQQIIKADSLA